MLTGFWKWPFTKWRETISSNDNADAFFSSLYDRRVLTILFQINVKACLLVLTTYSSSQFVPTFLVYQVDLCYRGDSLDNLIFFYGLELKKKQVQNMDLKKAGCKKQGHSYSKREEAGWSLFFLNNNDPVFCTLLFSGPYFGPDFFQGYKPTHVFKTRILGADWLGDCLTPHLSAIDFWHSLV